MSLGFGLGWSSFEYSRALSNRASITGLDLSPVLTNIAQSLFKEDESRLRYLCQDLRDPIWMERCEQYDACVMLDVYEHIPKNSRTEFHSALSKNLQKDALVILTCPSALHQAYLRQFHPEGLQPIDEDVTFNDVQTLATDIDGTLTHFSFQSIWNTNDYFYAAITRGALRYGRVESKPPHTLITRENRKELLKSSAGIFGKEFVNKILKSYSPSSFLRKSVSRLNSSILRRAPR